MSDFIPSEHLHDNDFPSQVDVDTNVQEAQFVAADVQTTPVTDIQTETAETTQMPIE